MTSALAGRSNLTRFACVALPKIVLGAGTLGMNVLLLRWLGAEQFGILSLCITAVVLAESIAGSAFDYTVLKLAPVAGDDAPRVHAAALQIKLLVSVGLVALCAASAGLLDRALFHGAAGPAVIVMTAAAASMVLLLRSAQAWMQSLEDFLSYGIFDLAHLCLRFGGIAVLAASGFLTPLSAMLAFLIAAALPFAAWLLKVRAVLPVASWNGALTRTVTANAKWMLLTFGIGALISRLDLALVARFAGLREAGLYSAAQVFALTFQMVGIYLSVVLTPRISPLVAQGQFHPFFRKVQAGVLAFCGLCFVGVLLARPLLQDIVVRSEYSRSLDIFCALLPSALAGFSMFPLVIGYLMFVRPRMLFMMDCVTLPVLVISAAAVLPVYGALGAAFLSSVIHTLRAAISLTVAWRCSRASSAYPAQEGSLLVAATAPGQS